MSRGTHGNGVILAETKKAAKSVIQALYVASGGGGSNVFMQEYVRESSGTDIRAFVVDGRVVASMKRKSLDEDFRSNIHQGGEGEKVVLSKEERKVVLSASKAMGLAICGVDFMRSDRGPLILEVNSSPGTAIEQITGRNVVAPIIDYVEKYALRGKKKKDRVGA
jgi:ribosomal protein S6--L-glutamate ligase